MLSAIFLALGAPSARELSTAPPAWCNEYTCKHPSCSGHSSCTGTGVSATTCATWCSLPWTSSLAHCAGCQTSVPISYTHTTTVSYTAGSGIQPYTKIKSGSCGYADQTGAVLSDPTVIADIAPALFYSFYSGTSGLGYITDTTMTSPDACKAYCDNEPSCDNFYYQYEYTENSPMTNANVAGRWMHKCQLNLAFAAGCGSIFANDSNDWDEYAGRASAAGQ